MLQQQPNFGGATTAGAPATTGATTTNLFAPTATTAPKPNLFAPTTGATTTAPAQTTLAFGQQQPVTTTQTAAGNQPQKPALNFGQATTTTAATTAPALNLGGAQ